MNVEAKAFAHLTGLNHPRQVGDLGAVTDHRPGHAEAAGSDGVIAVPQEFFNDYFQRLILLAGKRALDDGVAGDKRRACLHLKERQYCFGAADVARE